MNPKHSYPNSAGKAFTAILKKSGFCRNFCFLLIFCCGFTSAMAQHRSTRGLTYGGGGNGATNFSDGWGVAIGTGVDVPQGDFDIHFKPAFNINTSLYRFLGPLTASFSVGYSNFNPEEPVESQETVTVLTTNMPAFSADLGLVYNFDVADNFRVYGGADLGAYITDFGMAYLFDEADPIIFDGWKTSLHYAPKVGISFPLTQHLGINLQSKYNFYTQKLSVGDYKQSVNWNSFSVGAQLVFKF